MRCHQKRRRLGAKRSRVWAVQAAPSQRLGPSPGTNSPQGLFVSGLSPARLCNDAGAVSGDNPFGKGAVRAHGVVVLLAKASSLRVVARLALRPDSPFRTRLRSVNRP